MALATLAPDDGRLHCHLIVAHRSLSPESWRERLLAVSGGATVSWLPYVNEQYDELRGSSFLEKQVYLGIAIGERKRQEKAGPISGLFKLMRGIEKRAGFEDDADWISEREGWEKKSVRILQTLARVGAEPASAHDLAFVTARLGTASDVDPNILSANKQVWGPGETTSLVECEVTRSRKHLQIDTIAGTGYQAVLSFARFPFEIETHEEAAPWAYAADQFPFPIDLSSRFQLVGRYNAAKDVKNKHAEVNDQISHMEESGREAPYELTEQAEIAKTLAYAIANDQMPMVYAHHRLRIRANDPDMLTSYCHEVIQGYKELGIDVSWSGGDQIELYGEVLPGGEVGDNAYFQRQALPIIAGGWPHADPTCGDRIERKGDIENGWIGPFCGYILDQMPAPFHFDPHSGIACSDPAGVALIGRSGGGKTVTAQLLLYHLVLSGAEVVYIDPKADIAKIAALPELAPYTRVIHLAQGEPGILDPFQIVNDPGMSKVLALSTLEMLLGEVSPEDSEAIHIAIDTAALTRNPNLTSVMEILLADESPRVRLLGRRLKSISELPFARVCFAKGVQRPAGNSRLTIFTMLGLSLPDTDNTGRNLNPNMTAEQRFSVAVMYLVSHYARRLMTERSKDTRKAIFIDEAWILTATQQGQSLIPSLARMGRSHRVAVVLISQSAADLRSQAVEENISIIIAFRAARLAEQEALLTLLGIPNTAENRTELSPQNMQPGQCMIKDARGRVAKVQIAPSARLLEAFNTTAGRVDRHEIDEELEMNDLMETAQ